MIYFICGFLAGATVATGIFGAWLSPILDEQKLLIKKLELAIKYGKDMENK